MDISAILRAFAKGSSDQVSVAASRSGALLTTPYGLPYARWVAEGKGWRAIEATATAGVAALPTTTAGLTLQNGEPTGGKWYVVHSVMCTFEASAAAVETAYIAHCIGASPVVAATKDLAISSIKPLLGGGGLYGGAAILDLAATVVDDLWNPATSALSNAVASNGEFALVSVLDGSVILKPGAQYSLEICATSTAVTGRLGLTWFEVDASELS